MPEVQSKHDKVKLMSFQKGAYSVRWLRPRRGGKNPGRADMRSKNYTPANNTAYYPILTKLWIDFQDQFEYDLY